MRAYSPETAAAPMSLPSRRWIDLGRWGSLAVELPERIGEPERSRLFHALESAAQRFTTGLKSS